MSPLKIKLHNTTLTKLFFIFLAQNRLNIHNQLCLPLLETPHPRLIYNDFEPTTQSVRLNCWKKIAEVSSDTNFLSVFFIAFFVDCSILDPNSSYNHVINREPTAAIIRRCIGNSRSVHLKFIYSEKATKFCEISIVDLSYVISVKSKVEISQNSVAFSE